MEGNGGYGVRHPLPRARPRVIKYNVEQGLDGARDQALKNFGGTLESERRLTLAGHSGREIVASAPMGVKVRFRLYMVGKRLYSVMAIGSPEQVSAREVARFLESFKLTRR